MLVAAVVLHDCVEVEKNSPQRSQASRLSAARAGSSWRGLGWAPERIERLAHAIEAHSFSADIAPRTPEARIVQDADRLDAIGAIGVARCFYVAGRMGSRLYDPADPSAAGRDLDDRSFALDHFGAKLFRVAGAFQTAAGKRWRMPDANDADVCRGHAGRDRRGQRMIRAAIVGLGWWGQNLVNSVRASSRDPVHDGAYADAGHDRPILLGDRIAVGRIAGGNSAR